MVLLCNGCDHERETIRAYCPSCEEVTESYRYDPADRHRDWIADRAAELIAQDVERMRVNLPARIDRIAAERKAA